MDDECYLGTSLEPGGKVRLPDYYARVFDFE